jgi:hypothetical protein
MKSVLVDFCEGVKQLIVFLQRNLAEQDLMARLNESSRRELLADDEIRLLDGLLQAATNTKQYIYIVAIVSAYGLLERLVEGLIERYVLGLGGISGSFADLPEVVKKNHLQLSLALVDAVLKERFRKESSPESIVANLHSCLSAEDSYRLNGAAFSLHRGNVNIDKINEMLTNVGVGQHLQRILKIDSFVEFLVSDGLVTVESSEDQDVRKVFASIDELIEKRNEVSHGVVQVDDLESIDLLTRRCSFVLEYGKALNEVLEHETLKHAATSGAARRIGKPIAVYDNAIVCFNAEFEMGVGDMVFMLTNENLAPVRSSIVTSLQVDRRDVTSIEINPDKKFAAKVLFHAKDNADYFLLRSK